MYIDKKAMIAEINPNVDGPLYKHNKEPKSHIQQETKKHSFSRTI